MKKLPLIVFAFVLLAAACKTDTSIDTVAANDASADTAESTQSEPENDGDGTDETDPEPAQAAEPTEAPAAAEAAEPTEVPAPTVDTSNAAAQIGSGDWCTAAQLVEDRFDNIELLGFSDPEALEAAYTEAYAIISQARAITPPAIAADVDITIEGVEALIAALDGADWNFLDIDLSVLDALDVPLETATYNIEKYNFDVCGIGEEPSEPVIIDDPVDTDDDAPLTGTVSDQVIESLVTSGFTSEEAGCILDKIDFTDP
jgi:hypothetical protein